MEQIAFADLFFEQADEKSESPKPSPLYNEILELLESEISSAIEICERLIQSEKLSKDRYSSNKPKEYPKVCSILDEMVQQGKVIFIEDNGKKDRIYHLKDRSY